MWAELSQPGWPIFKIQVFQNESQSKNMLKSIQVTVYV